MIIRLNDLARQNRDLLSHFHIVLDEVVEESAFILRKNTFDLELDIKNFLEKNVDVIGVNSGTDAIMLALFGLNLKKGDKVIVPSRTYIASVSAIVHLGLIPTFVDIGEDLNLNANLIEPLIDEQTKAIMPVHLSGHSCDMRLITDIASKYNLKVVEDAAPAFGCKFRNQFVGTFGDFGIFSLHPLKVFGVLGDGGLLISKSLDSSYLRTYRDHGHPQPKSQENFASFGINSRLDSLQAGFAKIKLRYVANWIARRRKIAEYYSLELLASPVDSQVRHFLNNLQNSEVFYDTFSSYVLSVPEPLRFSQFMFDEKIKGNNIQVETAPDFPRPINSHPNLLRQLPASSQKFLEKTEFHARRTLKVPIYPELTDTEVEQIGKKMRMYFDRYSN